MAVVQCSGRVRKPGKIGRVFVHDARDCRRMVKVPEGQTIAYCRDHDRNGFMANAAARWQVLNDAKEN